jgi:hypothetical protein
MLRSERSARAKMAGVTLSKNGQDCAFERAETTVNSYRYRTGIHKRILHGRIPGIFMGSGLSFFIRINESSL